jgi:hypothetical protein
VHSRLADVSFDVPDGWRDTTTHQFMTADDSGTLIVESEHAPAPAEAVLTAALAVYTGVWGGMIIYSNRISLSRGKAKAPAAEGEQLAMDGVNRLRFALIAMSSAEWQATMRFLMPSHREFLPLVQRIVSSAHFSDEAAPVHLPDAGARIVQAGPLSFQIPRDWRAPDTFEFQHPTADEVTLTVTVAKPMEPRGTIVWDELISEPFSIVQTIEAPLAPSRNDWEMEWQLTLPSLPELWVVKKSVRQVTATTVVTAVLKGPESLRLGWAAAWSLLQRSLHPGFGR